MKALKFDLVTNAKINRSRLQFSALLLRNMKDNFKLIKSLPYIDKFMSKKTSEILKILG